MPIVTSVTRMRQRFAQVANGPRPARGSRPRRSPRSSPPRCARRSGTPSRPASELPTRNMRPTTAASSRSSSESPTPMHCSRVAAGAHVRRHGARLRGTGRDQVEAAWCPARSSRCRRAAGPRGPRAASSRFASPASTSPRNRCETSRSSAHGQVRVEPVPVVAQQQVGRARRRRSARGCVASSRGLQLAGEKGHLAVDAPCRCRPRRCTSSARSGGRPPSPARAVART